MRRSLLILSLLCVIGCRSTPEAIERPIDASGAEIVRLEYTSAREMAHVVNTLMSHQRCWSTEYREIVIASESTNSVLIPNGEDTARIKTLIAKLDVDPAAFEHSETN